MEELWDDYLRHLIWRCHLEKFRQYSRLFEVLHNTDFKWLIHRDQNRYEDGVELRDEYAGEMGSYSMEVAEAFFDRNCSVLEMMIALAIRVDDNIIGDPDEEHPEVFFMEMLKNLGLDRFKNNKFNLQDVIDIIDRWLSREFDRDGFGSPFPVRYDHRDQRKIEIYDQMNSYIYEKYS